MADRFPTFLDESADTVARELLGCVLERRVNGEVIRVRIVETEAYDQDDPASHAFGGPTKRNAAMFGESGHLYVYISYGLHHCCNIVAGGEGYGAGALIRAVEPLAGVEAIQARRGVAGVNATNGPGKLCQALSVDLELGGHDLRRAPLRLFEGSLTDGEEVSVGARIGISKAAERLRRFTITGNAYLSRR